MNVESYSRHGVSTSQAPPMRLLVKYRGIRRIAQRGTVPSALRGRGYDVKNIPIFSSGVLLGGCRLPPLELSTLPRQGLRRWFRTTIFMGRMGTVRLVHSTSGSGGCVGIYAARFLGLNSSRISFLFSHCSSFFCLAVLICGNNSINATLKLTHLF